VAARLPGYKSRGLLKIKMYKLFTIFFLSFFFALTASAAEFSLVAEKASVGPGEKFVVNIFVDGVTDDNCINTIEMDIAFPKELFSFVDFFEGESVASLWIKKPSAADSSKINNIGSFSLVGGMPGGYCGKIAGDQGPSNLLGRLIFNSSTLVQTSQEGSFTIKDGARVLLNDGLGTEEKVPAKTLVIELDRSLLAADAEKNILTNDTIQPEPFSVELHQSESLYNGLYYVIFGTNDKQSGIAYYEILELRPEEEVGAKPKIGLFDILFRQKRQSPEWTRLQNNETQLESTAHVLEDQSLQSIIKIKAVDKAGNERVVDFQPPQAFKEDIQEKTNKYMTKVLSVSGAILLVIVTLSAFAWFVIKRRKLQD